MDDIGKYVKDMKTVLDEDDKDYVNCRLIQKMLENGAEPIYIDALHIRGDYTHMIRYEGITFVSVSDKELYSDFRDFMYELLINNKGYKNLILEFPQITRA